MDQRDKNVKNDNNILYKGSYREPQVAELASVKQYIVTKSQGKKELLLRLSNDRHETLSGVTLRIRQYNVKGEYLRADEYTLKGLEVAPRSLFGVEDAFSLDTSCVDFKIDVLQASYGSYTYEIHGEDINVIYREEVEKKPFDTKKVTSAMGGRKHVASVRSLKAPVLFVIVACLLLALLLVISIAHIKFFVLTETCFTLDNIEYRFVDKDKDSGDIVITGYTGNYYNLIIPDKIEGHKIAGIDKSAFSGSDIRSIVIEGDAVIHDSAFANAYNLQEVTLKRSPSLGDSAFMNCHGLRSISLGDKLQSIGNSCFEGCNSLKSVTLPEKLKTIGDKAFKDSGLTGLEVPVSVEKLGEALLENCNEIESLVLPFIGESLDAPCKIGYIFGVDGGEAIPATLNSIKINLANTIVDDAFNGCANLLSIEYSKPVISIGSRAFYGCSSLKSFDLDAELTEIGEFAFANCSVLESIVIPEGIKTVKESTFENCYSASTLDIANGVIKIEKNAFAGCNSINTVIVPDSVEYVAENVFLNCINLEELTVPFVGQSAKEPSALVSILGDSGVHSIKSITVTGGASICDGAFEGITSLVNIYLSGEISEIGSRAFAGCEKLLSVNMPEKLTRLGDSAFVGCLSLQKVKLSEGVTAIEDRTFEGCVALTEIKLPDSVVSVGAYAFSGCTSLGEVLWAETMQSIGEYAFVGCSSLKNITIPSAMTCIPNGAFENCEGLLSVAIPAEVTVIGERAFAGCASLSGVQLPAKLETLKSEAFANCATIREFKLPNTVTELGIGVLSGCSAIEKITTPIMNENAELSASSGYLGYFFDAENVGDNSCVPEVLSSVALTGSATIADGAFKDCAALRTVQLWELTESIGVGTFSGCTSLIAITIPKDVSVIGNEAFLGCTALVAVDLPQALSEIGDSVFSGCSALSEIKLTGGIQRIGVNAFNGCLALSEIRFPEKTETISDGAFTGCTGLTELIIPDTVKSIGYGAFAGCSSLSALTLPYVGGVEGDNMPLSYIFGDSVPESVERVELTSVITLSDYAFLDCSNIKYIALPDTLLTIGNGAFSGCTSINELFIPDSVMIIGSAAILNCTGLSELFIPASVEMMGDNILGGCSALEEITVPFVGNVRADGNGLAYMFGSGIPESLKKVVITDDYIICSEEFAYCNYIEEIVIESAVTEIGNSAFIGCMALKSITLPDSVERINDFAFDDCRNLLSIVLPTSLNHIGESAFLNCYKLYEVYNLNEEIISVVEGGTDHGYVGYYAINVYHGEETANKLYVGGASYLEDIVSGEWYLTGVDNAEGDLVLPDAVSSQGIKINEYIIPAYLFCQDHDITSVTLTKAAKSMGRCAFFNCTGLKSVVMNPDCQIIDITEYSFSDCDALEEVSLSASVSRISDFAFMNCRALEIVQTPDKLESIGQNAFSDCQSLSSIRLPATLVSIEDNAFLGCQKLYEVYNLTELVIEIGSYDYGCVALNALIVHNDPKAEPLHDVKINDLAFKKSDNSWFFVGYEGSESTLELSDFIYNGRRVSSYKIAPNALNGNGVVKNLIIGAAASYIGSGAFNNCSNLESVDMNNCTLISEFYDSWFDGCGKLRSFVFPCNIERVSRTVFYGKSSLESVSFAGNLAIKKLPKGIFSECSNLKSIMLPDGLERLDEGFFENYDSLESVSFGNNNVLTYIPSRAFADCNALAEVDLPWGITEIGDSAFINCIALKSVDMKDSVAQIGSMAFASCEALRSVTLPENLNYIGDSAFASCTSLESIKIPASVKDINYQTFAYCSSLKSIDVPLTLNYIGDEAFISSGLTSLTLYSQLKMIGHNAFGDCNSLTTVNLSEASNLSTLSDYAFYSCSSLETVKLPERMTYIGNYAFADCKKLEKITLPKMLDSISNFSFNNCSGLKSIDLPDSLSYIGTGAFMECDSLQRITLPSSLERISSDAFSGCDALESVNLKYGIYEIGARSFINCTALTRIYIPGSVQLIGSNAFNGCTALVEADLSAANALSTLNSSVFANCSALESVSFSDKLSSIKSSAFENCSSLGAIVIPYGVSSIGVNAFYGCEGLCEIWNLSRSLVLEKGSEGNGYLAYYAIAIHDSRYDAALTYDEITVDGVTYYFAYASSERERYLYSIKGSNSVNEGMLNLPDYAEGDYIVTRTAINESYYNVIVDDSVYGFEYDAWNQICFANVFYFGDYYSWNKMLNREGYYFWGSFYEYVNCKHEDGETWSYDSNGRVTTDISTKTETVTKQPTCYSQGELMISCDGCGMAEYFPIEIVGHNCDSDHVCVMCGQVVINDAEIASKYLSLDFEQTFAYDGGYGFFSDNFGLHDTVAIMTFTADRDMTVTFDYFVSCESGGDYLYVVQGDYDRAVITGETFPKTLTLKLTKGEVITFKYEKDSSENDGEDRGYISNILIKYAN